MDDHDFTLTEPLAQLRSSGPLPLGLTVLWHPDWQRVGSQCYGPAAPGIWELHRYAPLFGAAPLEHRSVSRDPLLLERHADQRVTVTPSGGRMPVEVNGEPLVVPRTLNAEELGAGVVLRLGAGVLLCLHWMHGLPQPNRMPELVGVSAGIAGVRSLIEQVAPTSLPVLVLGETGTGKELVARAIHRLSACSTGRLLAVNMATLGEHLAAAELFGATRGAYTGAQQERSGLVGEAADGTLFLDEVGATPAPVQAMLLRLLETGEYRQVGGTRNLQSRARLIAATDLRLEAQTGMPAPFNQPLLRRLEAFVIALSPLRARRQDIGLLIVHFIQDLLTERGADALPSDFISRLCNHSWPGNVRQLAHVLRRAELALSANAPLDPERLLAPLNHDYLPALVKTAPRPAAPRRMLETVSDDAVLTALEHSNWCIRKAAEVLGVSRPSMYKLLARHPQVRLPVAIPPPELAEALARHGGDTARAAAALKTPSEALRRHLRQVQRAADAIEQEPA
ncbi:two-component system, NtrC family, nitrogen regulation response regulator GlnG [Duganella sp. CF402]|uniref:sigma 54-interacting transcriptional regulator n=1 Tax=unclassified Duganella TaxID=2636909 RepID=UPI0008D5A676|nr:MULTISPECIES: sigma 54-interacting transcriptional regulator [unclassified Duganella]RZT04561.1 two-component system nitrogen regulation response regulator GlnG [Duganella sp. BK701]SEM32092.1 two-component system, NtrC family, nitrogen regulation response regulator GlnG [Duganella sp. CF402]